MKRLSILLFLPLFSIVSCNDHRPTTSVELIDTSLSISPRAEASALDAVRGQIQRIGRGDRLILIPVTGDANNDAGGRILRLEAPTVRQAYDADLRAFRDAATRQFASWAAAQGADRSRTDLLGSLDAARQELALSPSASVRLVVIVSDFIEDDGALNFVSDPSLSRISRARALAVQLRAVHRFDLNGVTVCLGRLESLDFPALSTHRQNAIDAFWGAYLAEDGRAPEIEIDGLGMFRAPQVPCLTDSTLSRHSGKEAR